MISGELELLFTWEKEQIIPSQKNRAKSVQKKKKIWTTPQNSQQLKDKKVEVITPSTDNRRNSSQYGDQRRQLFERCVIKIHKHFYYLSEDQIKQYVRQLFRKSITASLLSAS